MSYTCELDEEVCHTYWFDMSQITFYSLEWQTLKFRSEKYEFVVIFSVLNNSCGICQTSLLDLE